MQSVWDLTLLLIILIHYTCRDTWIDFGVSKWKGGGVFGGANPPFQFQPLICEVFEVEHFYLVYLLAVGKAPDQQLTPSVCLSLRVSVRPFVCYIFFTMTKPFNQYKVHITDTCAQMYGLDPVRNQYNDCFRWRAEKLAPRPHICHTQQGYWIKCAKELMAGSQRPHLLMCSLFDK